MYESMTYEAILRRALARVSVSVDRREGSVIYDAIAPMAAELAMLYAELSTVLDRGFADTAGGEDLTKRAAERGIARQAASAAVRLGLFLNTGGAPMDLPLGSRFSGGGINFTVTARLAAGYYQLTAETAGTVGNEHVGAIIPITHLAGLGTATLEDILIPGEDTESDETLRARYIASFDAQAFGGNITDYREKAGAIPGVGYVNVLPTWDGGGTVKLIFVDSTGAAPSATLVETVQNAIDPVGHGGDGLGLAPIGHVVTVVGAEALGVDVGLRLAFEPEYNWELVQGAVTAALETYFASLIGAWEGSNGLVVRLSHIEAAALSVPGVLDLMGATVNGRAENLALDIGRIPVLGTVVNT